jgi:hypothetical protein
MLATSSAPPRHHSRASASIASPTSCAGPCRMLAPHMTARQPHQRQRHTPHPPPIRPAGPHPVHHPVDRCQTQPPPSPPQPPRPPLHGLRAEVTNTLVHPHVRPPKELHRVHVPHHQHRHTHRPRLRPRRRPPLSPPHPRPQRTSRRHSGHAAHHAAPVVEAPAT